MLHTFDEIVLTYRPDQLAAWKLGDKSLMPSFVHPAEGWFGFADYMLMPEVTEHRPALPRTHNARTGGPGLAAARPSRGETPVR